MTASSILVVDDDADTCASLTDVLGEFGCSADEAHGGREALKLAERGSYRLALLDYRMPDMSGTELFQRLRVRDGGIIGILITGHASSEVAAEAAKAGISALLAKPLEISELLPLVGQALGQTV